MRLEALASLQSAQAYLSVHTDLKVGLLCAESYAMADSEGRVKRIQRRSFTVASGPLSALVWIDEPGTPHVYSRELSPSGCGEQIGPTYASSTYQDLALSLGLMLEVPGG